MREPRRRAVVSLKILNPSGIESTVTCTGVSSDSNPTNQPKKISLRE
jgi:hypothetical protein